MAVSRAEMRWSKEPEEPEDRRKKPDAVGCTTTYLRFPSCCLRTEPEEHGEDRRKKPEVDVGGGGWIFQLVEAACDVRVEDIGFGFRVRDLVELRRRSQRRTAAERRRVMTTKLAIVA